MPRTPFHGSPMNQEMPKSPFDLLAEHYGPASKGSRKPCPGGCVNGNQPMSLCQTCHGTGFVVDTEHPIFKALWRYRPHHDPKEEYVRRSREEAFLPVFVAANSNGTPVIIASRGGGWWKADVEQNCGEADNPLDALSAALLAKEGVKTDVIERARPHESSWNA